MYHTIPYPTIPHHTIPYHRFISGINAHIDNTIKREDKKTENQ